VPKEPIPTLKEIPTKRQSQTAAPVADGLSEPHTSERIGRSYFFGGKRTEMSSVAV
jgi:hypothetical protein